MATAVAWAKVAANFFANRKVREAGHLGALVFLFVLCENAARDATGSIPASDLAAWFVADTLRITESEANAGIAQAVKAGLVAVDAEHVTICGWDDEWAKRPLTEAERKRKQRAAIGRPCPDTVRTSVRTPEACPECPGGEERRGDPGEKRKEEEPASPDAIDPTALRLAALLVERVIANNPEHKLSLASPAARQDTARAWAKDIERLHRIDRVPHAQIEAALEWSQADGFWRGNILSGKKLREKYDTLIAQRSRAQAIAVTRNGPLPASAYPEGAQEL